MVYKIKYGIIFFVTAFFFSCSTEPQPINYGHDPCSYCKMTIMDSRYGSELITRKGKIYKFDSAECLVNFVLSEEIEEKNIHQLLITDFATPPKESGVLRTGNFIDAKTAHYLISQNLPSPMGADLTGFHNSADAEKFRAEYGGKILTWKEVTNEIAGKN